MSRIIHRIFLGVQPEPVLEDPTGDIWLQENGDAVLKEDNSYILLENE